MKATIDFGNTRGKVVVFDYQGEMRDHTILPENGNGLLEYMRKWEVEQAIVSSVVPAKLAAVKEMLPADFPLYRLSHKTPLPIENAYKTPHTLGMDRLAAIVGAWSLFPEKASLVVDMGTCITYDFITDQGVYLGGAISPGLNMRGKAMHAFTAALPEPNTYDHAPLIGQSTEECLRSGAVNGVVFELEGYRQACQLRFEIFNTVLCGGDAQFFETKLKAPIFVCQELVSIGLYTILNHLVAQGVLSDW